MCTAPRVEDLDLTGVDIVAVDLETWDPELKTKGSGAVRGHRKSLWYWSLHRKTNMLFSHSS